MIFTVPMELSQWQEISTNMKMVICNWKIQLFTQLQIGNIQRKDISCFPAVGIQKHITFLH